MERIEILSPEHERQLLVNFLEYFIAYDRGNTIPYPAVKERAMDLARALNLTIPPDTTHEEEDEMFLALTPVAFPGPMFPFPKGPYS